MTPEQIKARCERWVEEQDKDWSGVLVNLEPLYREAMAKGLEMVIERFSLLTQVRSRLLASLPSDMLETTKIRNEECQAILDWCREEADKLKEPPCDTSSS